MTQEREPTKKELRAIRKQIKKVALEDIKRMHNNILANKPRWLPQFLWVRIVAIVLDPDRGQARG